MFTNDFIQEDFVGLLFVTLLTIAFTYYVCLAIFPQEIRDIKRYISNLEFHLVAPPKPPTPVVVEETVVQGFPTGPGLEKKKEPIGCLGYFKMTVGAIVLIAALPTALPVAGAAVVGAGSILAGLFALVALVYLIPTAFEVIVAVFILICQELGIGGPGNDSDSDSEE